MFILFSHKRKKLQSERKNKAIEFDENSSRIQIKYGWIN